MTDELYINGERVDMYPDTSTTLNFKSNIFGDISKITSSNSQTIKLPKTPRNRRILENATAPSVLTSFPYKQHPAAYYREGVDIVRVAYAIMLTTSSGDYEIALYWGVMANFQSWVDAGLSLRDLPDDYSLPWNASQTAAAIEDTGTYFYAAYDCGVTLTDANKQLVNIHPSANVSWLLSLISEQAGIEFEFPDNISKELATLAIPCLDDNASAASWAAEGLTASKIYLFQQSGAAYDGNIRVYPYGASDPHMLFDGDTQVYSDGDTDRITFKFQMLHNASIFLPSTAALNMILLKDGERIATKQWKGAQTGQYFTIAVDEEIDMTDYDGFYLLFTGCVDMAVDGTVSGVLQVLPHFDTLTYPSVFPIIPNLPDIKQIDFIKAICAIFGLFAMQSTDSTSKIRFVSIDELVANKAAALDWSSYLTRSNGDEPKSVAHSIENFARRNNFNYKDDDTVRTNANGVLYADNETIDQECDILTLPFAASDGDKIPHYRLSDDGTSVEDENVEDRIMKIVSSSGNAALDFSGLDFDSLIGKYYGSYAQVINNAVVIKEDLRLDGSAIRDVNYLLPIYLRQYGQYFAIKQLSVNSSNVEAELVRLPYSTGRIANSISIETYIDGVGPYLRIKAQMAVASDITAVIQYTNSYGYTGTVTLVISAGGLTSNIGGQAVTEAQILSITPEYDDTYSYEIAEQTTENE